MPAYMVAQFRNQKDYDAYRAAAGELNRKHGAKILTKSSTARSIEGYWPHDTMVIIEFASLDAAEKFYQSQEYADAKGLRKDAPPLNIVIVDGAA
jgi:uncharacterized protein (DUF1330 family)